MAGNPLENPRMMSRSMWRSNMTASLSAFAGTPDRAAALVAA